MLRRRWSRPPFHSSFIVRLLLVPTALLSAVILLLATSSGTEAQFRGISVPRMPRVSVPRVPRVAVPRTPRIATPKLPKPAVQPRKLTAPVTGTPKKPTLPVPAAASKQIPTATKQPTSQPAALSKPAAAAAPKRDQYGWADCHATGGVWGHSGGSCGHPTLPGASGSSSRPRLAAIPWFVPIVPHTFVDPLECRPGYEKIGETFYGGTKCAPIGTARARGSYYADDPSPPPPPPVADNDCMKARAGTAFFGIPGNPDPAAVKEACEAEKREAVAVAAPAEEVEGFQGSARLDLSQFRHLFPPAPITGSGAEVGIRPGITTPPKDDAKEAAKDTTEDEDPCKKDKNDPKCFCVANPDAPICKTDPCHSNPESLECKKWKAALRHIDGAIGEMHAQESAIREGHKIIQPIGPTQATGPDFISFDPAKGEIVVWDAKYRIDGRGYPKVLDAGKLEKWRPEVEKAVRNWDSPLRDKAISALEDGRIRGQIFQDKISPN
jgi:hypothetical protein